MVDNAKIIRIVSEYRKLLPILGEKYRDDTVAREEFEAEYKVSKECPEEHILSHCMQMLDKIEEFVAAERGGKAFRWLGFIQGVLWARGHRSLAALRTDSRTQEKWFGPLKLFRNDIIEWYSAESIEEAIGYARESAANLELLPDEVDLDLERVPDDEILTQTLDDSSKIQMCARQLANHHGRGFVMTTEY